MSRRIPNEDAVAAALGMAPPDPKRERARRARLADAARERGEDPAPPGPAPVARVQRRSVVTSPYTGRYCPSSELVDGRWVDHPWSVLPARDAGGRLVEACPVCEPRVFATLTTGPFTADELAHHPSQDPRDDPLPGPERVGELLATMRAGVAGAGGASTGPRPSR